MHRQVVIRFLAMTTALCAPMVPLAQTIPVPPADDAEYRGNWGLGMIDALSANAQGYTGRGVTVAIVDTGLNVDHPEFAGRISELRRSWAANATSPQDVSHEPDDQGRIPDPHGSHVTGIIAAARDGVEMQGAVNMQGVAYDATILPLQAIDVPRLVNRDIANVAIRYATRHGAGVLNGSFGPPTLARFVQDQNGQFVQNPNHTELDYQPIYLSYEDLKDTYDALKATAEGDVVLVFAAGNEYADQPLASARPDGDGMFPLLTPENIASGLFRFLDNVDEDGFDINDASTYRLVDPSIPELRDLDFSDLKGSLIAVVAVGQDGQIASYSNRCGEAAEWCLAAPGGDGGDRGPAWILSTWQATTQDGDARFYQYDLGTSMAAPHVSGAAAVVRSAFPYMTARQTIETILTTATDIGPEEIYGQGLLNLGAAVNGPMALRYEGVFDVDTQGHTSVWSNSISGPGDLTKRGAGTLVLAGAGSTYTGPTTVLGGTLAVGGSIVSPTFVRGGGTLAGTGTTGDVTLGRGGVLSPGSVLDAGRATGTLTVEGDLIQGAGSIYRAGLAGGGASDLVEIAGAATIDEGATIVLVREGGGPLALDTRYTLMTARDGIVGGYGGLGGDLVTDRPFVEFALGTGASDVYVDLDRSDVAFAEVGRTRNQRSVARAVEAEGPGSPLHDDILFLSGGEARGAFTLLPGEIHASARSVLTESSGMLRNAATERLRGAFGGLGSIGGLPGAPEGMAFAEGGLEAVPAMAGEIVFWVRGVGARGHLGGGDAARTDTRTGGFFLGADAPVGDDWRVGVIAGYSRVNFDMDDRNSPGSSDNYSVGLYAGAQWDRIGFRSGVAYTANRVDTDRQVAFPGFSESLSSDYDARTIQAFGEIGYRVDTEAAVLEPYASLAYVNLRTDGFDETGGTAALSGDRETSQTTFTTLGLRAARDLDLDATAATLRGEIGWRHAFGDVTPDATLALAGGSAFEVRGAPIARNAAMIEAGLDMTLSPAATLGIAYQGQFAPGARENGIAGTLTFRF